MSSPGPGLSGRANRLGLEYPPPMPNEFSQLLDATVSQLESLKARGVKHVAADPATLAALAMPVRTPLPRAPAPAQRATSKAALPQARTVSATPSVDPSPRGVPESAPAGTGTSDKATAFAGLRARAVECTRCPHLVSSRQQVVFGVGNENADLLFVGEAPGADEDAQGEPFVGRAGQLLTKIIQTMGLSREEVYIGNILKCRPDMPDGSYGNRKPTPEEMETCIPWLLDQIELIQPKVMVALGATAVEGLIGGRVSITRMRGQWQEFRGIPLMPTFHPSYLLRGHDPVKKRRVWEDMMQVMDKLGMPISEKQRGYFLKK